MDQPTRKTSQPKDYKLIVEKDVKIPLRDGTLLYADIFRPGLRGAGALPGHHEHQRLPEGQAVGAAGRPRGEAQPLHELGDGQSRCGGARAATACVRVDYARHGQVARANRSRARTRKRWTSTTRSSGSRSCPGAAATSARSASPTTRRSQWRVANLQPPSLKCIMPWEGRADQYRDQAYHGGIFSMGFIGSWWLTAHRAATCSARRAQLQPRRVPQRHDVELHAQRPRLRVLAPVQRALGQDQGAGLQRRQLGRLLAASARQHRGLHVCGVEAQEAAHPHRHALPPVPLRGGAHRPAALVRPLAEGHRHRASWTSRRSSSRSAPAAAEKPYAVPLRERVADRAHAVDQVSTSGSSARAPRTPRRWKARSTTDAAGTDRRTATLRARRADRAPARCRAGVSFETLPMTEDTEITGPIVLNVWVSSTARGHGYFRHAAQHRSGRARTCRRSGSRASRCSCVTKGWLRASHRKLDPAKSLPYRPYHAHDERWWLKPGEIGRVPGRDLADQHGVQEGPQAAPRHLAARTASARSTSRTSTPTTTPAPRPRFIREETSSRICCSRSFH